MARGENEVLRDEGARTELVGAALADAQGDDAVVGLALVHRAAEDLLLDLGGGDADADLRVGARLCRAAASNEPYPDHGQEPPC